MEFGIGVTKGDIDEAFEVLRKGIDDIRVEMPPAFALDDAPRIRGRQRRLVDAVADQCIEDVGERHQAGRNGNIVAGKAGRVAAAIPLFVVVERDLLGDGEKIDTLLGILLGLLDGLVAEPCMGFHDDPFLGRQLARLEQDVVGNTDLADVVQRCRLHQQFDGVARQRIGKTWMGLQRLGERTDVTLRAAQVITGLGGSRFGEPRLPFSEAGVRFV